MKRFAGAIKARYLVTALGFAVAAVLSAPATPAFASYSCSSSAYACTPGYIGTNVAGSWPWGHYGGSIGQTPTGEHNCTLYAAWRLYLSGLTSDPGNWGNASNWANAIGGGNHTPVVGSIAWYGGGSGHVAYVERVSGGNVFLRADNFFTSGGYTTAKWVATSSVPLFLHPHDSPNDLFFIKTKNTGSGHVEIHTASAASGYGASDLHAATWFSTADQGNGWFQMVGRDLYFIKTRNTGSGRIEIHTATAASGYSSGGHWATWLSTGDQSNGYFQMVGKDLYFIKTRNTGSGHVEVHTATAASGYSGSDLHAATWFGTGDQNNGWFQMVGRDLYFIKTHNTGSGHVEIHDATASSGFQAASLHAATWLSTGDANNGWFQMDNHSRELYFIKIRNTGSGHVEIHDATFESGYSAASVHAASWFSTGDQNNG